MVTYAAAVSPSDQAVFKALADPTRRALLDALFERDGQSLAQLCALNPEMTRFGVMKHLALLQEADLVVVERSGRTKRHFLNPVPVARIADRWISKYAERFVPALVELEHTVHAYRRPEESR